MSGWRVTRRGGRALSIAWAFLLMGARTALNYPINFAMSQLQPAFSVVAFFFVARFVDRSTETVGGDYFTFVVIGILTGYVLAGPLTGFGSEVRTAVQQGRFEMLLIEPVRWRALPFCLAQWPIVSRGLGAMLGLVLAMLLGATFEASRVWWAILVLVLGIFATLAIGTASAAVGVLSKKSDPLLAVYTMAAPILAGSLFPLSVLPDWLRWASWLVPHTYVLIAVRKAVMPAGGGVPGPGLQESAIALGLLTIVGLPVALWLFGRVMEFGRRAGLLGGY